MIPDVTVLMPLYNARRFVLEAVHSILEQKGVNFELLIIDDASTDGSTSLIEGQVNDKRVKHVILKRNRGMAAALNQGLTLIRSPFTAHMDSDDIALPNRLATQFNTMSSDSSVDILGGCVEIINEEGVTIGNTSAVQPFDPDLISWLTPFVNVITNPTVMYKTPVMKKEKYSEEERFRYCVDYELWCRINKRRKIANIPAILAKYRIHSNQGSEKYKLSQKIATLISSKNYLSWLLKREISVKEVRLIKETNEYRRMIGLDEFEKISKLLIEILDSFVVTGTKINNIAAVVNDVILRSKKASDVVLFHKEIARHMHEANVNRIAEIYERSM